VYVGNIHTQVTEPLLQEVFAGTGPVEGCKLIRKEKSSYGFIHYFDRRSAALAILSLNGRHLFGQPIKVNWALTLTLQPLTFTLIWSTPGYGTVHWYRPNDQINVSAHMIGPTDNVHIQMDRPTPSVY